MNDEQIQDVVRSAVREWLQSAHVIDVRADRDADFDGDNIIRVTILVDGPPAAFDRQRLAGLVTHLRETLAENDEDDFPMVSFRSHREHEVSFA